MLKRAALADLTEAGTLAALGVDVAIHSEQWRDLVDRGQMPTAYMLREMLLGDGFDGVIYPSFMSPGGTCVALWHWNIDGAPVLDVVDPDNRLPRSAASWV